MLYSKQAAVTALQAMLSGVKATRLTSSDRCTRRKFKGGSLRQQLGGMQVENRRHAAFQHHRRQLMAPRIRQIQ